VHHGDFCRPHSLSGVENSGIRIESILIRRQEVVVATPVELRWDYSMFDGRMAVAIL